MKCSLDVSLFYDYFQASFLFLFLQLLDLFSLENRSKAPNGSSNNTGQSSGQLTVQTMLSTLPDLWEDKQYEEEYDMKTFMNSLRKN